MAHGGRARLSVVGFVGPRRRRRDRAARFARAHAPFEGCGSRAGRDDRTHDRNTRAEGREVAGNDAADRSVAAADIDSRAVPARPGVCVGDTAHDSHAAAAQPRSCIVGIARDSRADFVGGSSRDHPGRRRTHAGRRSPHGHGVDAARRADPPPRFIRGNRSTRVASTRVHRRGRGRGRGRTHARRVQRQVEVRFDEHVVDRRALHKRQHLERIDQHRTTKMRCRAAGTEGPRAIRQCVHELEIPKQ